MKKRLTLSLNQELSKNLLKTNVSIDIHDLIGAGAYIVGEETAMLESIEGKKGFPRYKPPFPAINGLYYHSTIINNVETLASLPKIIFEGYNTTYEKCQRDFYKK